MCYPASMIQNNHQANTGYRAAFLSAVYLSILFSAGCAQQPAEGLRPNEAFPQVNPFDASIDDGGDVQPQAECREYGAHQFNNNFSPYFGGEVSVEVEVVHYSSFHCPHCARFAYDTGYLWDARTDYRDLVRIYFHHADYVFRHRAAVAAQNQGMEHFWALHDFIYFNMLAQDHPSDGEIIDFVEKKLKLDMDRFNKDLNSDKTKSYLVWELENAMDAGVEVTPTAYVCGHQLGNWYYLEYAIDDQLQ